MTEQQLEICTRTPAFGDTRVVLLPGSGGGIHSYRSEWSGGERSWMHPGDGVRPACFPMVPFCSRINQARFEYAGARVKLLANNPPEPHAIHGHGFQRPWQVQEKTASAVTLAYVHAKGDWPWSYRVQLSYRLQEAALRVDMTVENLTGSVMPLGLGLHPYFTRLPGTRLHAGVSRWLRLDDQGLPIGEEPIPRRLNLGGGVLLDNLPMDDVFPQWDRMARIRWPVARDEPHATGAAMAGATMEIRSSEPFLVVWAPAGERFFCVEPIGNLPDSFNGHADEGEPINFVSLASGASHHAFWVFTPGLD